MICRRAYRYYAFRRYWFFTGGGLESHA